MKIPRALLDKYNQPVPRYTSYPPANHFTADFDNCDYIKALEASNRDEPVSISLYIHIPFCEKLCFYCGCNSISMQKEETIEAYVNALKLELKMLCQHLDPSRKVTQVHYGGGTPNAISATHLEAINQVIFDEFTLDKTAEIAIECNPAHLDETYMDALLQAGFNRFSLGVQDFNLQVLKTVNRAPAAMDVAHLVGYLKKGTPDVKVNLDFIYGLPHQTLESFQETLQKAIAANPDRLVTFSYAHVPWVKKYQEVLEKAGLPSPEEKISLFEQAYVQLSAAGYQAIGLDHFAKPDDELVAALNEKTLHRNFQGYCTRRTTGQVYAIGVSGIGQMKQAYAQSTKNLTQYISAINSGTFPIERGHHMTDEELLIREVINELMCNLHISWQTLAIRLDTTAEKLKHITQFSLQQMSEFEADGLILINNEDLQVTDTGKFFIRNLAVALDPGLNNTKQFSKSV